MHWPQFWNSCGIHPLCRWVTFSQVTKSQVPVLQFQSVSPKKSLIIWVSESSVFNSDLIGDSESNSTIASSAAFWHVQTVDIQIKTRNILHCFFMTWRLNLNRAGYIMGKSKSKCTRMHHSEPCNMKCPSIWMNNSNLMFMEICDLHSQNQCQSHPIDLCICPEPLTDMSIWSHIRPRKRRVGTDANGTSVYFTFTRMEVRNNQATINHNNNTNPLNLSSIG